MKIGVQGKQEDCFPLKIEKIAAYGLGWSRNFCSSPNISKHSYIINWYPMSMKNRHLLYLGIRIKWKIALEYTTPDLHRFALFVQWAVSGLRQRVYP